MDEGENRLCEEDVNHQDCARQTHQHETKLTASVTPEAPLAMKKSAQKSSVRRKCRRLSPALVSDCSLPRSATPQSIRTKMLRRI